MIRELRRPVALIAALLLVVSCTKPSEESEGAYTVQVDPARFVAQVDNEFFPLVPGMTFIYEESDNGERVEVHVTDEIREVMGVACVVVQSREYEGDELVEETLDWYAQDIDGNVWYFGEDTKEYKDGMVVTTEGSWESGVDGALPGIIMKGRPVVGESYRQEYYKGHAEDMGEVLMVGDTTRVPCGSFDGVLVTRDWSPLEPGDEEQKYYAPGVGLLLEVEGGDRVELVDMIAGAVGGE